MITLSLITTLPMDGYKLNVRYHWSNSDEVLFSFILEHVSIITGKLKAFDEAYPVMT